MPLSISDALVDALVDYALSISPCRSVMPLSMMPLSISDALVDQ